MADEFGIRDVFEQVDTRLSNVEDDLRSLREEFRAEMGSMRLEMGSVRSEVVSMGRWLVGLMFAGWITVIASIWLKL